jgi:NADH-quinone oxidoreductase subunit L
MEPAQLLPVLLLAATLLPLVSFGIIVLFGPMMGRKGELAGHAATGAIVAAFLLSLASLGVWVREHWPQTSEYAAHAAAPAQAGEERESLAAAEGGHLASEAGLATSPQGESHSVVGIAETDEVHPSSHAVHIQPYAGEWYVLGTFGTLRLTIGYYIDALTVCMFCMVTLIASCIHVYAMGYMHEELHEVTDHEVVLDDGNHLHRPGRYHRFFQYMSLFCFSMLGLVVSGNVAMTFVFWELVGICSYFLIGFYVERQSACKAANKAFIVNRVGDFGMIIGLMALWGSLGTFAFGDVDGQRGVFSQVRSPENDHALAPPLGMVRSALPRERGREVERIVMQGLQAGTPRDEIEARINARVGEWRDEVPGAYWLLIVAGIGIFCGCIGKSAQFPLHVWLPDAMEGPTPVSALVHSATMVAAGVFLVARFYPVFTPEVLLVIAIVGAVTLLLAASIAVTATDIKRVLAYSTVSQLGYMMLALGVGGWLAGVFHLFTHAFFKSLLFLCSGSVIHAVHTNEMPLMGGLRRKMPWTAYTMLIGCLAIAGAGIPFVVGLSGYYSKDAILEHALSFKNVNSGWWGSFFFAAAAGGAAVTAFYMFRLWYLTFAGRPRDRERFAHAHESPPVMLVPLLVLSLFAVGLAWRPASTSASGWLGREALLGSGLAVCVFLVLRFVFLPRHHAEGESQGSDHHYSAQRPDGRAWRPLDVALGLSLAGLLLALIWSLPSLRDVTLVNLLEQARPAGTLPAQAAMLWDMTWPNEHDSHAPELRIPATLIAFGTALGGFLLATVFYGWRILNPVDVKDQFRAVYRFLVNKWWFDELYDMILVRPTHWLARCVAVLDRRWIDGFIDGSARFVCAAAGVWDRIADQGIVDGFVNRLAEWTYATGLSLRTAQTGRLRQYVMFIVLGTIAAFILASFTFAR